MIQTARRYFHKTIGASHFKTSCLDDRLEKATLAPHWGKLDVLVMPASFFDRKN